MPSVKAKQFLIEINEQDVKELTSAIQRANQLKANFVYVVSPYTEIAFKIRTDPDNMTESIGYRPVAFKNDILSSALKATVLKAIKQSEDHEDKPKEWWNF